MVKYNPSLPLNEVSNSGTPLSKGKLRCIEPFFMQGKGYKQKNNSSEILCFETGYKLCLFLSSYFKQMSKNMLFCLFIKIFVYKTSYYCVFLDSFATYFQQTLSLFLIKSEKSYLSTYMILFVKKRIFDCQFSIPYIPNFLVLKVLVKYVHKFT